MKKAIISLLLAVTMLLTMIPPALAEPEDTPPTPETGDGTTLQDEPGEDDPQGGSREGGDPNTPSTRDGGDPDTPGTGDDTDPADLYYLALTAENFPEDEFLCRVLYVMVTRPLHRLRIWHKGELSPLLAE